VEIIKAIRVRRSIRTFKPNLVPRDIMEEILDICRWAPSGGNFQPWYFSVLEGEVLDKIKKRLEEKTETSSDGNEFPPHPELPRTSPYPQAISHRGQSFREGIDSSLYKPDDSEEDKATKSYEFRKKVQRFFDAPNAVIIYSEDTNPSALIGIGIVCQTFCLAALAYGLGTCIMGQTTFWPEIYRDLLVTPKGKYIVTSIAIGYPDIEAPINNFIRSREPLDNLIEWHTH